MSESGASDGGIPLIEPLSPSPSPSSTSTKRKRDTQAQPAESKRAAKRQRTKKPKDIDDDELNTAAGVNTAVAHMDSRLLADHVAQRTKRFEPELSLVELEDRYIPERAILDTSSWKRQRDLENLPDFLEYSAGSKKKASKLNKAAEEKGSPHTIVVAGAGLRAADLTRALRKFQTKDAMVAKLFAKHIKLHEATEFCKNTRQVFRVPQRSSQLANTPCRRMSIGIGTPQRLIDLLNNGSLSTAHLERIVIDASHIDRKKRGVLDMKDTQVPLVQLLTRDVLKGRYGASEKKIDLVFY
ncbi:Protein cms1 [Cryomyces antarcticus]|nr:Protein cms1 [Cryomyces antarcticus]